VRDLQAGRRLRIQRAPDPDAVAGNRSQQVPFALAARVRRGASRARSQRIDQLRPRLVERVQRDRLSAGLGGGAGQRGRHVAGDLNDGQPRLRIAQLRHRRCDRVAAEPVLADAEEQHRARPGLARAARRFPQRPFQVKRPRRRERVDLRQRVGPGRGARVLGDRRDVPISGQNRHLRVLGQVVEQGAEHRALAQPKRGGHRRRGLQDQHEVRRACSARIAHQHLLERIARRPPAVHPARIRRCDRDELAGGVSDGAAVDLQ
jgi:hypothetical protein